VPIEVLHQPRVGTAGSVGCLNILVICDLDLMSVCPCIVDEMKRENQLDATQWFIELMIHSTCFGHCYAHQQEFDTIQIITACGT